MPRSYRVQIMRTCPQCKTLTVNASSPEDAERIAMDTAPDIDFSGCDEGGSTDEVIGMSPDQETQS